MKTLVTILLMLVTSQTNSQEKKIALSDFELINNSSWEGTLTYIDYQTGKPTQVETTMQIKIEEDAIITNLQYTYEPNKNVVDKIHIRKNGTFFGKQKVVKKTIFQDGSMEMVTTYKGKDDGKKATMFLTYKISRENYTVVKEVLYNNTKQRMIRNTYVYQRI
ncbi:hypothetical protein EYD45_01790 [Hyunsoonleella flava]|uniref:Uncharacterized protein n=1 Tax=Hyunsoonleella flava TaxID=2527939 RepID=A0A4Q9FI32_9FLAO|nr:hypothetical protein [Hyunsoonleella flava]TBN06641.1 hypothetical protein EYD45_01790 [Hyunsoonleella flava]